MNTSPRAKQRFPLAYRVAIERAEADASLRHHEKLVELCDAYATVYGLPHDDVHRQLTDEAIAWFR